MSNYISIIWNVINAAYISSYPKQPQPSEIWIKINKVQYSHPSYRATLYFKYFDPKSVKSICIIFIPHKKQVWSTFARHIYLYHEIIDLHENACCAILREQIKCMLLRIKMRSPKISNSRLFHKNRTTFRPSKKETKKLISGYMLNLVKILYVMCCIYRQWMLISYN